MREGGFIGEVAIKLAIKFAGKLASKLASKFLGATMGDELVVATGDNDGDGNVSDGGVTGPSRQQGLSPSKFNRRPIGGLPPPIDDFRAALRNATTAVNNAKTKEELASSLQGLLDIQREILAQLQQYLRSALPSCDLNKKIHSHNRAHHPRNRTYRNRPFQGAHSEAPQPGGSTGGSEAECEHPSHRLIAEIKTYLDPKSAALLEDLLNSPELTEQQSEQLAGLVAQALQKADSEGNATIAGALAGLLGEGDERTKVITQSYLDPLKKISTDINRTRLALVSRGGVRGPITIAEAYVPLPRSLLSRVQPSADYPRSLGSRELPPFNLTFSLLRDVLERGPFMGGEPLTGIARAVYLAAEWKKTRECHQLYADLITEIRQHYYKRFLAKSERERKSINGEIRDLQEQLNRLCTGKGWPPISVAYFAITA